MEPTPKPDTSRDGRPGQNQTADRATYIVHRGSTIELTGGRGRSPGQWSPAERPHRDDATAGPSPGALRLIHLLADFKAARLQRDGWPVGSEEWTDADEEIRRLQRQIFEVSLDGSKDRDEAGMIRGDHLTDRTDPDAELGPPERPSAI